MRGGADAPIDHNHTHSPEPNPAGDIPRALLFACFTEWQVQSGSTGVCNGARTTPTARPLPVASPRSSCCLAYDDFTSRANGKLSSQTITGAFIHLNCEASSLDVRGADAGVGSIGELGDKLASFLDAIVVRGGVVDLNDDASEVLKYCSIKARPS